ncbi:MAG: hypothetical protein NW224_28785 [Leptolyngbyaceae cyanobacterium bins.302]|nr:hypothetical protein [Leptolyngbyaceae cyanobacterium bins.302]
MPCAQFYRWGINHDLLVVERRSGSAPYGSVGWCRWFEEPLQARFLAAVRPLVEDCYPFYHCLLLASVLSSPEMPNSKARALRCCKPQIATAGRECLENTSNAISGIKPDGYPFQ